MVPDDVTAGLQPELLWRYFKDLTQIPRPSKHEHRVLQYLKDFAAERQLTWQQDAVGNLVIRRPGSGLAAEAAPCVVIQAHVDMVCEKDPSVTHDFLRDPLVLRRAGDWIQASGTTLGADNGIGAFQIAPDLLTGRTMLNLDSGRSEWLCVRAAVCEGAGLSVCGGGGRRFLSLSQPHDPYPFHEAHIPLNTGAVCEDWGEIFIGCAGGGDMSLVLRVALEPPPSSSSSAAAMTAHTPPPKPPQQLKLGGLLGGHSGLNIHEGRGNAVQLMGRALAAVAAAAGPDGWRLAEINGGDKRNAIARDASAVVLVAEDKQAAVAAAVQTLLDELRTEYGAIETGLTLELVPGLQDVPAVESVVSPADVERLLALLRGLPHGPIKFSHAVPGLVETSNNVASIKEAPCSLPSFRHYVITNTVRSSLTPSLEATRDVIQGLATLAGCVEVQRGEAYPGWQPNLDSKVLQVVREVYGEVLGGNKSAKVGAIHAGLECGILGKKFPGMDMVSFGPTIKGAHSLEERVQISTVEPFWQLTVKVLERLADVRQ
ncbi:hypothetical protein VOLCADRAFT_97180 [Volvox carteri f. nagariensis]|uniref:Peptidase M20 dimerisation domain-containing protein n=1 Tax=Volvox carteri f. nagariensis TaxID=3068 RepID=D8UC32_VOLCA|nr:uncharacterized protein VOLCADRAFT_97180 [Volvox carteri f. nagariensis]EFJ42775.1 hypothetical protein VOLCADRAFT_97180 [Volvox carteri f. nagariensis]|eukprot:XP_002956236.1 hypothetical protein VOLCADRAFT_97180 [Volvox carteri f. nagariensis]